MKDTLNMTPCLESTIQQPSSNPLGDINAAFHKLYQIEKDKAVSDIHNGEIVLICRMDNRLIIKQGQNVEECLINDVLYHNLKAMSHSSLAVYYSLLHSADQQTLQQVKNWISQIRQQEPTELGTQIADITKDLVDSVEMSGMLSHSAMSLYQQELEPIYAKLMIKAVDQEIDSLVTKLVDIHSHRGYPSSKTFLVVFGGHQPRYKALALQVFRRWFQGSKEHLANCDHHVRYCEGGKDLDDAVDLVANAMVAKELAKSTMGYSEALNQDVLSTVAERAIDSYWLAKGLG